MGVLLILIFISQCQQQNRGNGIFAVPVPQQHYQYQSHSQFPVSYKSIAFGTNEGNDLTIDPSLMDEFF